MKIVFKNGRAVTTDDRGNEVQATLTTAGLPEWQQRQIENEKADVAADEEAVRANEVTASAPLKPNYKEIETRNKNNLASAKETSEFWKDYYAESRKPIEQAKTVKTWNRILDNEKAEYDADREASFVKPTGAYHRQKSEELQKEIDTLKHTISSLEDSQQQESNTKYAADIKKYKDRVSELTSQKSTYDLVLAQLKGGQFDTAFAKKKVDQVRAEQHNYVSKDAWQKDYDAVKKVLSGKEIRDENAAASYASSFFGQAKASYQAGRLNQDIAAAWNAYLDDPTKENKEYAQDLSKAYDLFARNNQATLEGDFGASLISKDWAGYAPQFIDQLKARAGGAAAGAVIGTLVGDPIHGAKIGATISSGKYSYAQARGAAYKSLIDLGVDENTARKAASDEAVISSVIEMGDTAIDMMTLGSTKLLESMGKEGIKGLGTYLAKWAGENKVKKLAASLGLYGINIFGEGVEEWLQEGVSIANQNRFVSGNTNNSLLGDSTKVLWNAITGKDKEAQAQMAEAFGGGVKIALMSPLTDVALQGTAAGFNAVYNANLEAKVGAEVKGMYGDMGLITSTLENSAQDSTSRKIAEALKKRIENGGKAPTDSEIGKLFRAIQEETQAKKAAEAAKQTKAEQQKTDDLAHMVQSDDTAVSEYAASQLASPDQKVVSPYAQELMDAGMTPEKATAQSDLIEKVVSGHNLTKAEASNLKLSDQSVRQVFIKATGTEVTDGQARNASQARKIIRSAAEVAQARAKLQEQQAQQAQQAQAAPAPESEPITPSAAPESEPIVLQESPAADAEQTTTARPPFLSKEAAEQALLSILERGNAKQEQSDQQTAEPTIRFADGTTMTATQFEERFPAENPNASADDVLAAFQNRAAYNAMGQAIPGSAATASMRASLTEPADGQDIVGRTMSDDAQRAEQDLTVKMLDNLGKKLGVSVRMEDSMDTPANGYYDSQTKTIVLNRQRATTQRMVVYYFAHELVHHGTAIDGQTVVQNILDAAKLMGDGDWLARKTDQVWKTYTAFHEKRGESFTEAMRDEEVAADYLIKAMSNRAMLDTLAGHKPGIVKQLIARVKASLKGRGAEMHGTLELQKVLDRLQKSLKNAEKQGLKKAKDGSTIESKNGEVRYSAEQIERTEEGSDYRGRQDAGRIGERADRPENYRVGESNGLLGRGNLGGNEGLVNSGRTGEAVYGEQDERTEESSDYRGRQDAGRAGSELLREGNYEFDEGRWNPGRGDLGRNSDQLVSSDRNGDAVYAERTEDKTERQGPERADAASLQGRNPERADSGGRQNLGRAGSGPDQQTGDRGGESGRIFGRGNLGRSEGLVIPEKTRKIMDDKGIPNVGLIQTDDRSAFSAALDQAKAANPNGGMVDSQSVESLSENNAKTFMIPGGGAGIAVEADGNIIGVFKNPAIMKARRVVYDLIYTALAQGGDHLDCYATYAPHDLSSKYAQFGFEPVAWLEFNRECAPDNWNYDAWGEPDVVMWVHNGDTVEQIVSREEAYKTWTKDEIHALPKFDDYGEAKAYQKAELEKRKYGAALYLDKEKINTELDPKRASIIARHTSARGVDYDRILAQKDQTVKPSDRKFSLDPDTGYEVDSVQDRTLKLLKSGSLDDAVKLLQQWADDVAQGKVKAKPEEQNLKEAMLARRRVTPEEAAANRTKLTDLIQQYGEIKSGEKRARPVFLPKRVEPTKGVSKFARTVAEAKQTPLWFKEEVERAVANEESGYTYTIATDKAAMNHVAALKTRGYEVNLRDWENLVASAKSGITKNDIALGEFLYTEAVKAGNLSDATRLVAELAEIGTAAGQTVQAMSLLKKMTPSGQLYYLQKAVDRMNKQFEKQIENPKNRMTQITVNPKLAEAVLNATTQEEVHKAMDALLQSIADQVPVTFAEQWNAWRYLSMLGNPKTHIRNMLSNAVFAPVVFMKDVVGAVAEGVLLHGDQKKNKTKNIGQALASAGYGLTFGLVKPTKYVQFANSDYQAMKDVLSGGGKHNPVDLIRDKRNIFGKKGPGKALEAVSRLNSKALDVEDLIAMKSHYVRAMSQYLAAQKANIATLESTGEGRALLAKARSWAVQEAQKATFRDASALASALNRFEKSGVVGQVIAGGVVPFKKTPINILKRGVEYSPLGILKAVKDAVQSPDNAAKFVDSLSSALTGTAVMYVGYYLAAEGLLRGGGSDDEEESKLEELAGAQDYSLRMDLVLNNLLQNFGVQLADGTSMTIDWMAPAALPLFAGAAWFNAFGAGEKFTIADFADTMTMLAEPMFQLSMLDGLNRTLKSIQYSDNKSIALVGSLLTNYFGQAVPTLFGQIARTIDDTRRGTYLDKNSKMPKVLNQFLQTGIQAKIPVWAEDRIEYLDAWGRADTESNFLFRAFENFISPGYWSKMSTSPMEEELLRVYKVTGEGGVLPTAAAKYFNVNKERYDLSADEWSTFQKVSGQTAYKLLTDLVNSRAYQSLTDQQKAEAIQDIYDYAKVKGREAAVKSYKDDTSWIKKADELLKKGISLSEFVVARTLDADTAGNSRQDILKINWLSDEDKAAMLGAVRIAALEGDSFLADPDRTNYGWVLTSDRSSQRVVQFDQLWTTESKKLMSSAYYRSLGIEGRAELLQTLEQNVLSRVNVGLSKEMKTDSQLNVDALSQAMHQSAYADELSRLYNATGNYNVILSDAEAEFGGIKLTADTFAAYRQALTENNDSFLAYVIGSKEYKDMDDKTRAYVVSTVERYVLETTRSDVISGYQIPNEEVLEYEEDGKWIQRYEEYHLENAGITPEAYAMARGIANSNGDSKSSKDVYAQSNLNDTQKAYIALTYYHKGFSEGELVMTDKNRSKHRFYLTEEQRQEYLDYYDALFASELAELIVDGEYKNATSAEQAAMFDSLKTDVANDTKKHFSDIWPKQGIYSERKKE